MKNIIISLLLTYIFWSDFVVMKMWYAMPFMFLCVWLILAEIEETVKDYQKTLRHGRRLQRQIERMKRGC